MNGQRKVHIHAPSFAALTAAEHRLAHQLGMRIAAHASLCAKLNPARYPKMPGEMAAIVGCILGRSYSKPQIAQLMVTSEDVVLARTCGEIGFHRIIGTRAELVRHWESLCAVAGLTAEERRVANMLLVQTLQPN